MRDLTGLSYRGTTLGPGYLVWLV